MIDYLAMYKDLRAQFDAVLIELNETEAQLQLLTAQRDSIKERALGLQRVTVELGNFIEVQPSIELGTAPVLITTLPTQPDPAVAL